MSQVYVCVRECKCDQQGDSNKNNICMNRTHTYTHAYTCRFSLLHTSNNNNNNKCVHYASGDPCVGMGETAKENEGTGDKTDDESEQQQQLRGLGCQGRC